MSDTPMSEERLTVLEYDGHLASVEASTPVSAALGRELQEACREIRRLQELVDELGEVLYAKYLTHQRACLNNAWPDTWTRLLIRAGKLKEEDVV